MWPQGRQKTSYIYNLNKSTTPFGVSGPHQFKQTFMVSIHSSSTDWFENLVCKMAAILFGSQLYVGVISTNNYNDVTWVSWRLKSPATKLFLIASSKWQQRKYQGSALLAPVREIHRSPMDSPHKGISHAESVSMSRVLMKYYIWQVCLPCCLLTGRQLLHTVHHQCEALLLTFCSHRVSWACSLKKRALSWRQLYRLVPGFTGAYRSQQPLLPTKLASWRLKIFVI